MKKVILLLVMFAVTLVACETESVAEEPQPTMSVADWEALPLDVQATTECCRGRIDDYCYPCHNRD